MFKEKSSKKKLNVDNKDASTLDAMHNKMIKTFEDNKNEIDGYKSQLIYYEEINNNIMNEIEFLKTNNDKDKINILWSSNIYIKEKIIETKKKIYDLNCFDEIDYYNNTCDILFQYYDTIEKQSKINSFAPSSLMSSYASIKPTINKTYKGDTKKKKIIVNTVNVLDALNNLNKTDPSEKNNNSNTSNMDKTSYIEQTDKIADKSSLVDKYLSIINKQYVKTIEQDEIEICKICKNSMTCLQYDAIMICNCCGYQELLLVEQNRPILKQNTKDTSHFSYKRINHFREWCNQVQGKESTDIPDEIFEKILNEIKKEKIIDTKTITYNKMRDILKRLRINKYYEHINYIINRINGIPTPQFSPELEETLCTMFRNIQGPFLKHCPKDRKNFLSYSYVLYKFFQILGLYEYLKYFPLLKSREKLYVQDQIWKKICKDLNYEVIPSL